MSETSQALEKRTGLSRDQLRKIRSTFGDDERVRSVVLFGSRAKGCAREGSDIDLAVFGDGITARDAGRWKSILEELLFPWSVDVVVATEETDRAVLDHIERVGIELLGAQAG